MKIRSAVLYILWTALIVSVCIYVSMFHYQLMLISGSSMEPTYSDMSLAVIDKHQREHRPGDVVLWRSDTLRADIVKRIAAVPGDSVRSRGDTLLINGKPVCSLPPIESRSPFISEEEYIIPSGLCFLLGDNYEKSVDSRYAQVGLADEGNIIGTLIKVS